MKKKFFLLSLMLAAVFTASATVVKTIGTGGAPTYDYGSLYEASDSLNQHPLTEDMVWKICTDLTETVNAGIVNNTIHTLTITVDAAATRTITYNPASDNAGPSGHIVIGGVPGHKLATNSGNIGWAAGTTKNVIIDGSFNGDGEQHLNILGGKNAGVVLVFYGDVTETIVKNCYIENTRTGTSTNYAVILRTEQNTDNCPNGVILDNCYLKATGTVNCQTVYFRSDQRASTTSTTVGCVANTTLRNCEIVSNLRGVFFNGANNANFEGCTFRMPSASAGYLAHGIMGNIQSGVINVKGCKFLEIKTNNISEVDGGVHGVRGITASGGATVWNIENNIFTGLDALNSAVTSKSIELCAIRCGDSCVVRHNTFVMPVLTYKPATPLVSTRAIALLWLAGDKKYPVENNIFISHETTAHNSLIRGALNQNCGHNVFYHDGGNAAIIAGAAIVTDEADLVTADPTSNWKEVEFNADMSLADASIGDYDLAVTKIDAVGTDINGKDRYKITYAGAEAPGTLANTMYMIGGPAGFHANSGTALTKIANDKFSGVVEFAGGEHNYFCFSPILANDDDAGGWAYVNGFRMSGTTPNQVLTAGEYSLSYGVADQNFDIADGKYEFTIDVTEMTVKVVNIVENVVSYDNASGLWALGAGIALDEVEPNVFERECYIPQANVNMAFTTTPGSTWEAVNHGQINFDASGDYWVVNVASEINFAATGGNDNSLLFKNPGSYKVRLDFNTNKATITQLSAVINVTTAGYATYYNGAVAYTMPTGMAGYVFNVTNRLQQVYAAGDVVPAATPLVLGAAEGTYDLVFTTGGVAPTANSLLVGSDVATPTSSLVIGEHKFYGLSLNSAGEASSVGFYWMAENGGAFENGAHKAFLAVPVLTYQDYFLAPAIRFEENNATDIQNIEGQEKAVKFIENGQIFIRKDGVVYDAMGRVIR